MSSCVGCLVGVFFSIVSLNCVDKSVGRGNLRGEMTDAAAVEVVIKPSKEQQKRHKKKERDLEVEAVVIAAVMPELIHTLFFFLAESIYAVLLYHAKASLWCCRQQSSKDTNAHYCQFGC